MAEDLQTRQIHRSSSDPSCQLTILQRSNYNLVQENTFLYRLRDAPQAAIIDISALATYDDSLPSDEDDDDGHSDGDEYEEADNEDDGDYVPSSSQPRRGLRRWPIEPVIDIGKFIPLYRQITIEAEHNRCNAATQRQMAAAISVFAAPKIHRGKMTKRQTFTP